jgi:hypothetical protein
LALAALIATFLFSQSTHQDTQMLAAPPTSDSPGDPVTQLPIALVAPNRAISTEPISTVGPNIASPVNVKPRSLTSMPEALASQESQTTQSLPPGTIQGKIIYENQEAYPRRGDFYVRVESRGLTTTCEINEQGQFQCTRLFLGSHILSLVAGYPQEELLCHPASVYLGAEHSSAYITLTVKPQVSVTIQLLDYDTQEPVPNADITVASQNSANTLSLASDEQGYCSAWLIPDEYRLLNAPPDQDFIVKANRSRMSLVHYVATANPRRIAIHGTLVDARNTPTKGMVDLGRALIEDANEMPEPNDTFTITLPNPVPNGDQQGIAINATGELATRFSWNIDDANDLQIILNKRAGITGQVLDPQGKPLPNASIRLVEATESRFTTSLDDYLYVASLNNQGLFNIIDIPTGLPVMVKASYNNLSARSKAIDLKPGEDLDIGILRLTPRKQHNGTITGVVTDHMNTPVINFKVKCDTYPVTYKPQGHFEINELPEDERVTITLNVPGHTPLVQKLTTHDSPCRFQLLPPAWQLIGLKAPPIQPHSLHANPVPMETLQDHVVLFLFCSERYKEELDFTLDLFRTYGFMKFIPVTLARLDLFRAENPTQLKYPFEIYVDAVDNDFVETQVEKQHLTGAATHSLYHIHQLPAFVLIDKQGIVRAATSADNVGSWIQRLLAE